jgi:hypothetical protein
MHEWKVGAILETLGLDPKITICKMFYQLNYVLMRDPGTSGCKKKLIVQTKRKYKAL